MSRRTVVLIGGGEHGRVVGEALQSNRGELELLGFIDRAACAETATRLGVPWLGDDAALLEHPGAHAVLGLGALGVTRRRADAVARLSPLVAGWAKVIHRAAWVSPSATIGDGTVLMAGALVQSGARIGAHCVVNTGAIIEHDAEIGDFALVGPGAVVGGGARIGSGSFVGLGACVRDHRTIGEEALVAMGAVVVSDIPDGARVKGSPAR
jgi:acetyltransferase EpsM